MKRYFPRKMSAPQVPAGRGAEVAARLESPEVFAATLTEAGEMGSRSCATTGMVCVESQHHPHIDLPKPKS